MFHFIFFLHFHSIQLSLTFKKPKKIVLTPVVPTAAIEDIERKNKRKRNQYLLGQFENEEEEEEEDAAHLDESSHFIDEFAASSSSSTLFSNFGASNFASPAPTQQTTTIMGPGPIPFPEQEKSFFKQLVDKLFKF